MRFRNIYMLIGSFLVLAAWVLSDPDLGVVQGLPFGSSTVATLLILSKTVLYVGVLHLSRKALVDYLDLEVLFEKARTEPTGAGLAVVGVGLILLALSITIVAATSH
jgi:multisubunit Na+/H+ antiporter MnhB subunit